MTTPTDEAILTTLRARVADAKLRTPGGVLTNDDLRGVIRTTANIHRVDVPRVLALAMMEGLL